MVILQEPFHPSDHIDIFRRYLGFDEAVSNTTSKIWCFWNFSIGCSIVDSIRQQLTMKVEHNNQIFYLMAVYARTEAVKRKKLWRKLTTINNSISGPWSILGDFNSIMSPGEKRGGVPHVLSESTDFISCMDNCGMTDLSFTENLSPGATEEEKEKELTEHPGYFDLVQDIWSMKLHGNAQWIL
ncbi:hypothetical protein P3S68_028885 [Capsicum galapagoense]